MLSVFFGVFRAIKAEVAKLCHRRKRSERL